MQINLIYRKRYPTAFSVERLFTQLAACFEARGARIESYELPYYNNTLGNVRRNSDWAGAQVQCKAEEAACVHHITADVTSVINRLDGPTVITIHDCNPLLRYPKWHPRYWFYRWVIYEWPARRAAAVTLISEKTRTELLRLTNCKPDNLHVIPNCVDPAFTFDARDFNAEEPTILQIGVMPNKNIARLAYALRDLKCRLVIVGEPSADDQTALTENGVNFTWATGLSDEEVRSRYRDCDLLAFASTYEGFGLPILEAQMTGRPVVTSNLSPHREVAGPGGAELVDPYNPDSIRAGIRRVIDGAAYRQELIAQGRENALTYSAEAIADRYLELYSSLT